MESLAFSMSSAPIDIAAVRAAMADENCGAYAQFEGWVRNVNDGRDVMRLEYEAHEPLAEREGLRIIEEAVRQFGLTRAACVHRTGLLELGDCAVIVAVTAPHRDEAFNGCRYIIDEVKQRLPIWKKEHYATGETEWVNCQPCSAADQTRG
jgi:molybdopterin synthase catalytic subunit